MPLEGFVPSKPFEKKLTLYRRFDRIRIQQYLWYRFVESDFEILVLQLFFRKYVHCLLFSEENENKLQYTPVTYRDGAVLLPSMDTDWLLLLCHRASKE